MAHESLSKHIVCGPHLNHAKLQLQLIEISWNLGENSFDHENPGWCIKLLVKHLKWSGYISTSFKATYLDD
jgi:hypothetical protein